MQVKHLHMFKHRLGKVQRGAAAMHDDDKDANHRKQRMWRCESAFRNSYVCRFPANQDAISASGISPAILDFDFKAQFCAKPGEPVVSTAVRVEWPRTQSRSRASRKFTDSQLAKSASVANRLARSAFRHHSGVIRNSCKDAASADVSVFHRTSVR